MATPPSNDLTPVDKTLVLLIIGFAVGLVAISKFSPNDGQTFQVLSGLLTGFSGAFLARIQPTKRAQEPGSTTADPATPASSIETK